MTPEEKPCLETGIYLGFETFVAGARRAAKSRG
jgi:hypothetical protein